MKRLPLIIALAIAFLVAPRKARTLPAPSLPIGERPPAFALADDAGRPFSLASLRGAPSLLIFFRGST